VFQVGCSFEVKTQNVNEHMHANPPIEAKTSHDNLDFIGGFKCNCYFTVLHSNFGLNKQPEMPTAMQGLKQIVGHARVNIW